MCASPFPPATLKADILTKLQVFAREDFRFEEGPHKYYLGAQELKSATTYLHRFARPFDSPYWSRKKAQERGVSPQAILAEWKAIADRACYLGTEVHKWIEDFYNGIEGPLGELDAEVQERIQSFQRLYARRLHKLTPLAQELRMFNLDMQLAGTLDALFCDEQGEVWILDWKTNKALVTDQDKCYGRMQEDFASEWDNNMNHYSIQTSIYRLMLSKVGIHARGAIIVHVPPLGDCQVYKCKDYRPQLVRHFYLDADAYHVSL